MHLTRNPFLLPCHIHFSGILIRYRTPDVSANPQGRIFIDTKDMEGIRHQVRQVSTKKMYLEAKHSSFPSRMSSPCSSLCLVFISFSRSSATIKKKSEFSFRHWIIVVTMKGGEARWLLTNKHSPIYLLIASMNHTSGMPLSCIHYSTGSSCFSPFPWEWFLRMRGTHRKARAITFVRRIRDSAQSSTCSSCSCFTYKPLRIWHSSRIPCPIPLNAGWTIKSRRGQTMARAF